MITAAAQQAEASGRVPPVLQFQAAECALAALAMLMGGHGCHVPLEELRQVSGVSGDGSSLALLKRVAARYGFHARAFRREPEALAPADLPCMAFVNFNHMLVVESMAAGWVDVVDPASGRRRMDAAEFDRIYTGVILCVEPTAAMQPRPRRRLTVLPGLLRAGWGWWAAAVVLALAGGFGEAVAALALRPGGNPLPALATAAAAAFGMRLALRAGARALQEQAQRLTGELLFSRCATFFAYRSPALLMRTATAPRDLARLAGAAPLPALTAMTGAVVPLVALVWHFPLAGAAACLAWAVAALAGARVFWAAGAAWRRARHEGGAPDIAGKLRQPEAWQLNCRDDDALSEMIGTVTRAIGPAQSFAQAVAILRAVLAAAAVGAVGTALAQDGGLAAPALALLAVRHWLQLPAILPPLFSLPMLAGLLEDLNAAPPAPPPPPAPPAGTALALRAAAFAYGANPILADLDLCVRSAARVGITGASGCGKSTLARLMAGVLPLAAGSLARGAKMALVPGQPVLFEASIADNVACWRPGIGPDRIKRALRTAGLWDEIAARPEGMDSMVEAEAANLSGGQRRRLMLARALADDPDLVILDETLDAVDRPTEQRILDALRARGIAVVLLSQRHESLAGCDQAWRLVAGRCVPWHADEQGDAAPSAALPAPLVPPRSAPAAIAPAEWAALTVAGRALGLVLPPTPSSAPCPATQRPLVWQARLHGLFLLPVSLHTRTWHRRSGTVLLARRDGEPVVLVPRPLGGMRAWDAHGGWRSLDATAAAQLDEHAHMLCRRPGAALDAAAGCAWDRWAEMMGGAALWLGLLALTATIQPVNWAAALAVALGTGAAELAGRRAGALRGLAASAILMGQALRLSPRWLHIQGMERVTRWLDEAEERASGQGATRVGLAVTGMAVVLSGHPVAAAVAAIMAALLALWRAWLDRRTHAPTHQAADFLLHSMLLAADTLGTPLTEAVRRRWLTLDDIVGRQENWRWRADLIREMWSTFLPPTALALGVHFLPLAALPTLLVAVLAGDRLGTHLAHVIEHARQGAATRALETAPREDGGILPLHPPLAVAARQLSFAYDQPVLRNVSLGIAPGEVVAIAGPSGSGKSTLLRLLMGLELPQQGCVLTDGTDMRRLNRLAWRAHVAAVLQDERLEFRSIASHVRGRAAIDLDEVAGWLVRVGLWPKVAALPMGVASLVESRLLPSGQAALLMVARAMARRPAMLFLDETLAPLDPDTQARVLAAIRAAGVTCIFTSHQEDLLCQADRILRIANGTLRAEAPPPRATHAGGNGDEAPPSAFGAAGRLYRAPALARLESPDREDMLPELAAAALFPALVALAVAVLGAAF
ncbi:MAG: ATP-binding cassette domain-containing protein [Bacteroidales bacterium]